MPDLKAEKWLSGLKKTFVNTVSANQNCCGDNVNCYKNTHRHVFWCQENVFLVKWQKLFSLVARFFSLQQEFFSIWKNKKFLCQVKNSCCKKKYVLSLNQGNIFFALENMSGSIFVTIEIVTTTILVYWGCINKRFL